MQTNNEAASPVREMASWVRRDGVAEEGHHMRNEENEEGMARPASSQSVKPNHELPQETDPRNAAPAAPQVVKGFGHNTRLAPRDVKRAVLEHVQAIATRNGKYVPNDIVEFLERADVLFLDENNQPIKFARVVIAWED